MKKITFILLSLLSFNGLAVTLPTLMAYPEKKEKSINEIRNNKVLIFLNKTCPCTQQNIPYVNKLVKAYPGIEFIGVHSVKAATVKDIEEVIEKNQPNFTIVDDSDLKIANILKANRTPQTFILDANNSVIYSGGITERTNPEKAQKFYLKNALEEITQHKEITEKETRSLGCIIIR